LEIKIADRQEVVIVPERSVALFPRQQDAGTDEVSLQLADTLTAKDAAQQLEPECAVSPPPGVPRVQLVSESVEENVDQSRLLVSMSSNHGTPRGVRVVNT